jgi:hypothetical protein
MANTLKIKRSSVPSKVPLVTDLQLGELAVNTYDGKLYTKRSVAGVETIVDLTASGGGGGGSSVTTSDTAPALPTNGDLWWNTTTGELLIYYFDGDSGQWVSVFSDVAALLGSASYDLSASVVSGGAGLVLGKSDDTTDTVRILSGNNTTVLHTDDSTITINATDTTYTAGGGLTLAGTQFSHTDTSSAANLTAAARRYVTGLTFDTYGHVTAYTTGTETVTDTTYTAGNGISLAGTTFTVAAGAGLIQEASGLAHADTSTAANLTAGTRTYVTGLTFDTYGHTTGYTTGTETVTDTVTRLRGTTGGTYTSGDLTLAAGASITVTQAGSTITVAHTDTSSQASVDNSGGTVIQDITLDTNGHITAIGSVDLDLRYTTPASAREAVGAITYDMTGWPNRTDTTLSFNEGTRTFTLGLTGASATAYYRGKTITFSAAKTFQIANTYGSHYINMDGNGNLYDAGPTGNIREEMLTAYVFWDNVNNKAIIFGDERHSSTRDLDWHYNQHLNLGAVWRAGGGLTYTLDNASAVSIAVGNTTVADEDLIHSIVHAASPSGPYQQILEGAASIPVIYYSGTQLIETAPSTLPWIAGTTRARYNPIVANSGSLADASEGSYICYWLFGTNDTRYPIKLVMGRLQHASVDAAYSESFDSLGINLAENVGMYQIVLQTSTAYTQNAARVQIKAVRRLTEREGVINTSFSADSHESLTGRSATDSHPISAITDLQTTLNGKQATLVSGTNIKTINGVTVLGSGNLTTPDTTYTAGNGISLAGTTFTVAAGAGLIQEASGLAHADTSTAANLTASARTYVTGLTFDTYGHVTGYTTGTETVVDTNTTYTAGNGLSLSGTTFNVGGTANRITVGATTVDIASTYVGQTSITTLGTVTTGTWDAGVITDSKISTTLTGKTYNGLSLTANSVGFDIQGGTTAKTLTVANTLTLAGTDSSTLNVGAGGTLKSGAFTQITVSATAPSSPSVNDLWIDIS